MTADSALVIGQSGGATAVINASLVGIVESALASGKFSRILGMRNGVEGLLSGDFIELGNLTETTRQTLRRTPSAALGTGRYKLTADDLDYALDGIVANGIEAFAYIGGNDSADSALRLSNRARDRGISLNVASVPKTIDNDLPGMDHCPGYGSIARYLGNAVRDATYDSIASPQLYAVKFVEVMGRDAGWVSASGALGFGEDEADLLPLTMLPERAPAHAEEIVQAVDADLQRRGWTVVVIPETLRSANGNHLGGEVPDYVDPYGHAYFPSTGAAMTRLVTQQLGVRTRYEKPGTAARMSVSLASEVDLDEAYRLGEAAGSLLAQGESGFIPVLTRVATDPYRCEIGTIPIHEVANRVRHLPPEFIREDGLGTTQAFRDYALPLLGPNPFPPYARIR